MKRLAIPFAAILLCGVPAHAQTMASPRAASTADLPVTDVALYTSGVGFFQREGSVDGDASEALLFPVDQINDILKSLVLLDNGGGTIEPVTYAAQDSITKQLQAFSVDLSDNPDRATLLGRLRGAAVKVTGANYAISGTVLAVETKTIVLPNNAGSAQESYLSLMADDGMHTVALDSITAIQFLDPKLDGEIRQALSAVAQGRDMGKRSVVLNFDGKGRRHVTVGYITASPLWQTSYRLVLGDKPILQGWANVQNTGQDDWSNVHLSLVSGRPVSFIQDLYTPIYVTRPTVQAQVANAPGPQTYGSNLQEQKDEESRLKITGEVNTIARSNIAGRPAAPSAVAPEAINAPAGFGASQTLAQSVATTGAKLGTALFSYDISVPVSVPRMQSAMIPFLSSPVQARHVSIYNNSVLPDHPMSGARMVNSSNLHLMGGPITVFDQQTGGSTGYVGDAEIDDTEPGQTRLFSYAVDLGVDGDAKSGPDTGTTHALVIAKGILEDTTQTVSSTIYTFKNNTADPRLLVVEQPFSGENYTLVQPVKADEKTADRYRFDVPLTAKESKVFTVKEQHIDQQTIALIDCDLGALVAYSTYGSIDPDVKAALREVAAKRRTVADTQAAVQNTSTQIAEIGAGQDRIRKNMAALDHSSALYKRYTAELDQQETQLEQLSSKRDSLQTQLAGQQADLSNYLANLSVK